MPSLLLVARILVAGATAGTAARGGFFASGKIILAGVTIPVCGAREVRVRFIGAVRQEAKGW